MNNIMKSFAAIYRTCSILIFVLINQTRPLPLTNSNPSMLSDSLSTSKISLNSYLSPATPFVEEEQENIVDDSDSDSNYEDFYQETDEVEPVLTAEDVKPLDSTNDEHNHPEDFDRIEDEHEDDEDVFADTMSVNRPQSQNPSIDSNRKSQFDQSTTRIDVESRRFFSKPAELVALVGISVLVTLSAVIFVMFLIYRLRKKDEGSYVLEDEPRKSPCHIYTKVSSREFFA